MTILYVSGPMTGKPGYNFDAFDKAEHELSAAGYVVLNPAGNFGGNLELPRAVYMRLDIQQVLMSDGIALLDGYRESKGARLEIDIAHTIGLRVQSVEWWVDEARDLADVVLQEHNRDVAKADYNEFSRLVLRSHLPELPATTTFGDTGRRS